MATVSVKFQLRSVWTRALGEFQFHACCHEFNVVSRMYARLGKFCACCKSLRQTTAIFNFTSNFVKSEKQTMKYKSNKMSHLLFTLLCPEMVNKRSPRSCFKLVSLNIATYFSIDYFQTVVVIEQKLNFTNSY